jgi:hypothetical protein
MPLTVTHDQTTRLQTRVKPQVGVVGRVGLEPATHDYERHYMSFIPLQHGCSRQAFKDEFELHGRSSGYVQPGRKPVGAQP